jgi:hypothetical protein
MPESEVGLSAIAEGSWSMPKVVVAEPVSGFLSTSDEAHVGSAELAGVAVGTWSVPEEDKPAEDTE